MKTKIVYYNDYLVLVQLNLYKNKISNYKINLLLIYWRISMRVKLKFQNFRATKKLKFKIKFWNFIKFLENHMSAVELKGAM